MCPKPETLATRKSSMPPSGRNKRGAFGIAKHPPEKIRGSGRGPRKRATTAQKKAPGTHLSSVPDEPGTVPESGNRELKKQREFGLRAENLARRMLESGQVQHANEIALNALRAYMCADAAEDMVRVLKSFGLGQDGQSEAARLAIKTCIGLGEHPRANQLAEEYMVEGKFLQETAFEHVEECIRREDYASAARAIEAFDLTQNEEMFEFRIMEVFNWDRKKAEKAVWKIANALDDSA